MTPFHFLLHLLLFAGCNGFKYLVWNPKFGRSHVLLVGKLADELANAGHEVVVVQTLVNEKVNFVGHTNKSIRLIEVDVVKKVNDTNHMKNVWEGQMDPNTLAMAGQRFRDVCIEVYNNKDLLQKLKNEKFDVGVGEWFDVCGLGLFKFIGIRSWITVFGSAVDPFFMGILGVPPSVSIVPGLFDATTDRSFVVRLKDQFAYFYGKYKLFPSFLGRTADAYQVLDQDITFEELIAQSAFIWVNADEFVDFPRPISHKYVNIGGYGMKKATSKTNKLDAKYQKIFDQAKKGVVFMSFGSVAESKSMPEGMKQSLLEAFRTFPDIQFIWKYEDDQDNIAKDYPNVHTDKWLPQREILAHPKTLVFMTHGGMNSITEATYIGMPTICIPLFADQSRNAAMVKAKGISKVLNKKQLFDKQAIIGVLNEVINDPSYKRRAQELGELIRNKPGSPERRIVESAEFAARFDVHKHLDITGRHLCAFQFYNIDIFAVVFTVVFVLLTVIFIVVRCVLRLLKRAVKTKEE